jgi:glycosyltransferase involved in cell wall biosynthesis
MKKKICLVPKLSGLGGTASFQAKLIDGLNTRGVDHTFDLTDPGNTAILVIGGTRQLWRLWRANKRGVRVVQRLNGINWMHRIKKTSVPFFIRSEINNHLIAFIRRSLADHIVYQSAFCRGWWNKRFGERPISDQVTHNGVDLNSYSPTGPGTPPEGHYRILLVEGRLVGAYAWGLHMAVKLAETVRTAHQLPVELMVVGEVSDDLKAQAHTRAPNLWITWGDVVPREDIPAIDRSAHVLLSADLNAACPNSVIEALACGLPVLAYDTGALAELVQDGAGEIVPYGSDHWQLEEPSIPPLAQACVKILQDNPTYRSRARTRAEAAFSLDQMVAGYLEALLAAGEGGART